MSSDSSKFPSLEHEAIHLILTNQFNLANKFLSTHTESNPKIALLASYLSYLNAISSHGEYDLTEALNKIWATEKIGSCVQILQESYLKAVWNIRKSYNFYYAAQKQLEKHEIMDKNQLDELTGWISFGVGVFNMFLSLLPPTVLQIASFAGYSSDRQYGLQQLKLSSESNSFMAPFSSLTLLSFYVSISAFTGDLDNENSLSHAKQLIDQAKIQYPHGALFALFESRYYRCLKDNKKAVQIASDAIGDIKELPSVAVLFHYNRGWSSFFLLEFEETAKYLDKLLYAKLHGPYKPNQQILTFNNNQNTNTKNHDDNHNNHNNDDSKDSDLSLSVEEDSKKNHETGEALEAVIPATRGSAQALYAFHIGICYGVIGKFDLAVFYLNTVSEWLKSAKKSKPIDLYSQQKALEILSRPLEKRDNINFYLMDVCEMLYSWNGFNQMDIDSLNKLIIMLSDAKKHIEISKIQWNEEEWAKYYLSMASIQFALANYNEAKALLDNYMKDHENYLLKSNYSKQTGLIAFIYYQQSVTELKLHNLDLARTLRHKSANIGKSFHLYNALQIRVHALKGQIKKTRETLDNNNSTSTTGSNNEDD